MGAGRPGRPSGRPGGRAEDRAGRPGGKGPGGQLRTSLRLRANMPRAVLWTSVLFVTWTEPLKTFVVCDLLALAMAAPIAVASTAAPTKGAGRIRANVWRLGTLTRARPLKTSQAAHPRPVAPAPTPREPTAMPAA